MSRGADQAGGGIFRSQLRRSVRPTGSRFETACNRELTKCVGLERVLAYENASDASEEDFGFSGCSSCIKYTDDGDLVAVAGPDCRVVLFDALDEPFASTAISFSALVAASAERVIAIGRDALQLEHPRIPVTWAPCVNDCALGLFVRSMRQ